MKLRNLTLENFRGFESITVNFDPRVTLLLGGNGAGKTALLEGAAVALGAFFLGIDQAPRRSIGKDEARRVTYEQQGVPDLQMQWPVVVTAAGTIALDPHGEVHVTWSRALEAPERRTTWRDATIQSFAQKLQVRIRAGEPVDLPVIALYGTQRLWLRKKATVGRTGVGNRFDGYAECLDIAATARLLSEWMKRQTMIELQAKSPHPQLAAVQTAVRTCIDGVSRVWFDIAHNEIRLAGSAGVRSFSILSDGYRNMVALVADLARRAAILNPHHGPEACERADGVVLIDELELHLHPAWQRRIVGDLQRTFPRLQFIATTHSPQVVASVKGHQIRMLKANQLVASSEFVEGRDSNGLLEDVFGVPARPDDARAEIDQVFRLLDDEQFDAARVHLAQLRARLGPDDSAVVRAQWVLDTEAPPIPVE